MQYQDTFLFQLKNYGKATSLIAVVGILGFSLSLRFNPGAAAAQSIDPAVAPADGSQISSSAVVENHILPAAPESIANHRLESSRHTPERLVASMLEESIPSNVILYTTRPGDTLQSLASRFDVDLDDIYSEDRLLMGNHQLIDPNVELLIPREVRTTSHSHLLLPDSELVYSPSSKDFDVSDFANEYGGYLTKYREMVDGIWMNGPEVVARAALDNSINPRLLLAILEYRSGWLTNPEKPRTSAYLFPIWQDDPRLQGLYLQLMWAAEELSQAYYGWREGTFLRLTFPDGSSQDVAPELNAGTVAIQHLLSRFSSYSYWPADLSDHPLIEIFTGLYGDPLSFDIPIFDMAVRQPEMSLPFPGSNPWIFTGGPHSAWGTKSAWAALDFAPKWDPWSWSSNKEILSVADGVIARLDHGVIVVDLDGDGYEQTGWSIQYLHVIASNAIAVGQDVSRGQLLGHASIEGGVAKGIHLHIARKYNGEWILADGPLPFELGGWRVRADSQPYEGVLYQAGCELLACLCSSDRILDEIGLGDSLKAVILPNLSGYCPFPQLTIQPDNPEPHSVDIVSGASALAANGEGASIADAIPTLKSFWLPE
jgi:murein DD-endopeptidase MepM/ murein hydrolase activator NlpD